MLLVDIHLDLEDSVSERKTRCGQGENDLCLLTRSFLLLSHHSPNPFISDARIERQFDLSLRFKFQLLDYFKCLNLDNSDTKWR